MLIVALIVLLLLVVIAWASFTGAPWVPARRRDFEALLDDAQVQTGDHCVELGCGDGRLLLAAAARGAKVVGYEINPLLWAIAWLRCATNQNVSVRLANFWDVNLASYDVVITFLVPRTMPRLANKAKRELQPCSRLVSYVFAIPHKKPRHKGTSWYVYTY